MDYSSVCWEAAVAAFAGRRLLFSEEGKYWACRFGVRSGGSFAGTCFGRCCLIGGGSRGRGDGLGRAGGSDMDTGVRPAAFRYRIGTLALDPKLKMQMGPCGAPGTAHYAEPLALGQRLPFGNENLVHMGV